MRILDDETEIKVSEDKFHKFITNENCISDLFADIDKIIFNYSQYAIGDNKSCGANNEVVDHLLTLKSIRDLFISED